MGCNCGKNIQVVAHGAVGVTKAILHIDRPTPEDIRARRNICRGCEFNKLWFCSKCGCALMLKTAVGGESCPEGKW